MLLARQSGQVPRPPGSKAPTNPSYGSFPWIWVGGAVGGAVVCYVVYRLLFSYPVRSSQGPIVPTISEVDRDNVMRQILADARAGKK